MDPAPSPSYSPNASLISARCLSLMVGLALLLLRPRPDPAPLVVVGHRGQGVEERRRDLAMRRRPLLPLLRSGSEEKGNQISGPSFHDHRPIETMVIAVSTVCAIALLLYGPSTNPRTRLVPSRAAMLNRGSAFVCPLHCTFLCRLVRWGDLPDSTRRFGALLVSEIHRSLLSLGPSYRQTRLCRTSLRHSPPAAFEPSLAQCLPTGVC